MTKANQKQKTKKFWSRQKIISLGIPLAIFTISFLIYYLTNNEASPFNNLVRLADAFIHGQLSLPADISYLELAPFKGKFYVIPPPLPAILILPGVLILGLKFNQTLASVFFGSINTVLAYALAYLITKNKKTATLLAIFFGFGTIHWWAATSGGVWTFSQTVALTFLFLAVYETLTKQRPFIMGILLGCSYWCRLPTVLSFPFFIIMLWNEKYKKQKHEYIIALLKFSAGLAIFIALNFMYNYIRFGSIFDMAYFLRPEIFSEHWFEYGFFNPLHFPRHIKILFASFPMFLDKFPYIMPSWSGLAIWITSPAFIYALFARKKKRIIISCWLAIISTCLLLFNFAGWGFAQFGYRFALDFYPFLFLLTIIGIGPLPNWRAKLLILISIIVNLWGVLWIYKFGWVGV